MKEKNIILIGMPGCGKSTVGVVLAKAMGYRFMDSDLVIQEKEDRLLCDIIGQEGIEGFCRIENRINSGIEAKRTVIATGGSVVYGDEAMRHFKSIGIVVYLRLPYEEIEHRLGDLTRRGVVIHPGQTLRELYDEREPMYRKYADIVFEAQGLTIADSVYELRHRLKELL